MNSTLEHFAQKFNLDLSQKPPIWIEKINRTIMAQTLHELGFTVGAEVGVQRGNHAELLFKNIPGLKLYAVDSWVNYPRYRDFTKSLPGEYELAKKVLAPFNVVYVHKYSMDAIADFKDNSLDFVYIDAAHDFKHVAEDMCEWARKVRVGGIVFGHDFKRNNGIRYVNDVKDVVPAYCYAHRIRPWFVLGQTGRHDGIYREGTQSWMFVRQESDRIWL